MNTFCTSSINDSINVKETSGFITVPMKFTFNVAVHSLRPNERNADCEVKIDNGVILYEVQTSDFLQIAVVSLT